MRMRLDRYCGVTGVLALLLVLSINVRTPPGFATADESAGEQDSAGTEPAPASPIAESAPIGSDWPDFRNGVQLNGVAGTELPADPQLIWEKTVTDGVTSTPAIVGERVYVATLGGLVLCMNLSDGEIVWEYSSVDPDDPSNFPPAFIAPLTVAGETAYVGDDTGTLHAINIENGERHGPRSCSPTSSEPRMSSAIASSAAARPVICMASPSRTAVNCGSSPPRGRSTVRRRSTANTRL